MKTFEYVVKDELGIHARPAGLLVKVTKPFASKIVLQKSEKEADAKRLMAVMALGVKKDDRVLVTLEGEDEEEAYTAIKLFFEANL